MASEDGGRSRELLAAGLRALAMHDLDAADRYLAQLQWEGRPEDYRELSLAFLREAA